MRIGYSTEDEVRIVTMSMEAEHISAHVDTFRRFLVAAGFGQELVDDYVPAPSSDWSYDSKARPDRG